MNGIHSFLTRDVDNDGSLDVILNSFDNKGSLANSAIWLSVPKNVKDAEVWERHVFATGDAPGGSHYLGFGDIDGDGWGEISLAGKGAPFDGGNWFAFWKNPGKEKVKGKWDKTTIATQQIGATNILPGDINGDGKPDFLASLGHGVGVVWFESPHWNEHRIDSEMESPHSLVLADLDADGDLDAASCGFKSERLSIYFNDGKGQFIRKDLDTKQQSYDLRAIDMDGDGDLDLLNAGKGTLNVTWYKNPHL